MLATLALALFAQETPLETHPIELRVSPLVELWLDIRWRSEQEETPEDEKPEDENMAAAVAAMRRVREALGSSLGFGLIEANVEGAKNAEELALAFEDLPEVFQSRGGTEVVLRKPCIEAAAAVAVIEPAWREEHWPEREKALLAGKEALAELLVDKAAPIYARLHRNLGLRVADVTVPVYLVTQAPWPGAFTHRRVGGGGGGVSFVSIEEDLPSLLESLVHETIHALDIVTPGDQSLLVKLRAELVAGGLTPRATRDWAHTIFFLEAGACVRAYVDPEYVDYGHRTDYYARAGIVAATESTLWKRYTSGALSREELIAAIVEAAAKRD